MSRAVLLSKSMYPAERSERRRALAWPAVGLLAAALFGVAAALSGGPVRAQDELTNPLLGDPEAIEAGENLFRRRCVGCHWAPKRGPNLFESEISDEKFLEVVINGRKRSLTMPPFGYVLSPDEVWQIHAFVKARDRL